METTERLDLSAIKERYEAAAPGPWKWNADDDMYRCDGLYTGRVPVIWHDQGWVAVELADAEFVAHARTDVPALVAEVERLRALLGEG